MDRARADKGNNFLIFNSPGDDGGDMQFVQCDEGDRISFEFSSETDSAVLINLNKVWSALDM